MAEKKRRGDEMKISFNALNKSYAPKPKTPSRFGLGIGFTLLYLACAVPAVFATEASQSNSQVEALFVTDYVSEAIPIPDTRMCVYKVSIGGSDEQPEAEVIEVVFDAYEYWRSTLSVDPTVQNYAEADDFYSLELRGGGLEYYPEHNTAVFTLNRNLFREGKIDDSMCFVFGDEGKGQFCMVDVSPGRYYVPGFIVREEKLYVSLFDPFTPCEMIVFETKAPSQANVSNDYVNFYAERILWTEGDSIFFEQMFPVSVNSVPSEEEKAKYEKTKRVQLPLVPSKPFPPHRKIWVLEENKEDCLVLREHQAVGISSFEKEGFQAVVTIMKEKNKEGVNPVVWEEEPYTAPEEPALKHKIATTPEYSLWSTESGTVCKIENGQRSTVKLDLEQDEQVFLVKNKAFIKKRFAHNFAELQICDTETLFSSTKSEREASSVTLKIDNEKLREDINGLRLIMPVAPKK
jgi:hypothetical protein